MAHLSPWLPPAFSTLFAMCHSFLGLFMITEFLMKTAAQSVQHFGKGLKYFSRALTERQKTTQRAKTTDSFVILCFN